MKKYFHLILFFILSLSVVYFLFSAPYLFLLDFSPNIEKHTTKNLIYCKDAPVYGGWLLSIFSFIFSPEFYNKFLIFLVIFLSCYSAYSLASLFKISETAKIYAAILYAINPYTYIRIVVGHLGLLFGYSLIPLGIKFFIHILENKKIEDCIKFVLIACLIATNSHSLFIFSIIIFVVFVFKCYKNISIELAKLLVFSFALFLVLNFYWIIPLFTTEKETILSYISEHDLLVFAPKIEEFSILFTLASMHGFWRPAYSYAKDFLPFWEILFVFILFLAIHGFICYYNNKKLKVYVKIFAVIWIIGLILAAGIKSPFEELFKFLFDITPLIKGMRDSHKFVAMLCLSYSLLGALGIAKIEKDLKNTALRKIIIALILLVPLIYSFTFFNGFAQQIKPSDFPEDWYLVKEFLKKDEDEFRILFFPWHLYMDFHWIPNKDKRIANPAQNFFAQQVISAKNIEIPGVYTQVFTPYQVYIDYLLKKKNEITNFGELVSIIGVKYILLTKEVDYKNYLFLFNQSDLELVMETENFYVFKNKEFRGLIFGVNELPYVKDWEELIELSKTKGLKKEKIEYKKISPVKYVIMSNKTFKFIIFTEEYSKEWKLNTEQPIKAYNVVNAYAVSNITEAKEIVYERFYKICLPSYIISVLAFIMCICYLFYKRV